jgi:chitodextrinase
MKDESKNGSKRVILVVIFLLSALLTNGTAAFAQSPPTNPPFQPAGPPPRPTQPPPPDPSLTAHTYTQAPTPTTYQPQPLNGIAPYFFPGTNYQNYFPSPLMWSYFGLSEVMTNPNDCTQFDWTIFDEALDESAVYGRQMVFRFYLEYPGGTGSHPANATPQCLINQGVTMQTNPYWGSVHPIWDDPRTIQCLEDFITAFAARYDTDGANGGPDPRIAYMTAGLIGLWGEWHEWPYDGEVDSPNMMASASTVQAIVSTYQQAFHNIQLEIRYAYLAGVVADTTIGLHDDSWDYREYNNGVLCGDTLPESLGGCSYAFLQYELDYGLENRWITQSIGGEARPEIQGSIYSSWPNGNGQVDNPKAATELSHVVWLLNQDGADSGYSPTDPNIIAGVGEMGYKFYVPQANFNNSVNTNFNVGVTIENLGVSPFYYPWTVILGLQNSSGTVVQTFNTTWDLRTIQPVSIRAFPDWNVGADPTYISYGWPMNFETTINSSGVAAGTYNLVMRVVNPLEAVTQAILESRGPAEGMQAYIPEDYYRPPPPFYFWNTNFSNGWLNLGSITLSGTCSGNCTPPTPPTLVVGGVTSSTVALSWSGATDKVGVTGYYVDRNGVQIANVTGTSYTDAGLAAATQYTYTVYAYDAAGNVSTASNAVTATTSLPSTPPAPTLSSTGTTTTTVSLSWTTVNDVNGGITYKVDRGSTQVASGLTSTTYTDTGLTPATQYTYTVYATDSKSNVSPASNSITATTVAASAPPPAPTLSSGAVTNSSVALSWSAVTDTAGVTGYEVFRSSTMVASVAGTTYTDTGLMSSTQYSYTVEAMDAAGNHSAASNTVTVTTLAANVFLYEADDPASQLSGGAKVQACSGCLDGNDVGYIGNNSGILVMNPSVVNGGSYTLAIAYVNGDSSARSAQISINGGSSTTYSFSPTGSWSTPGTYTLPSSITLTAGKNSITVSNSSGWAPDIDHITLTLTSSATTPPTAPGNLTAGAVTSTSVALSWTASTSSDSTVSGYYVYRGSSLVATVTGTSYTDTALTPSTQYSYTVKAFDAAGNVSAASNTVTVTTAAAASGPPAPTLSSTGVTSTTVSLSWNAVTDSAGVTGYEVYRGSTQIATVTGTTYTVTGLTASTTYTFSVYAVDASGAVSPQSNVVSATTAASATTISIEAEASTNTLAGGAVVQNCSGCSGGKDVGYIGNNSGTLTFNFSVSTAGSYNLTIAYVNGDSSARTAQISVNGGTAQTVSFAPTGSWTTPNNLTLSSPISLNSGANTIEFSNSSSWAPDIDKITLTLTGSGSTTPPTPPTLTAGTVTATTVALSWSGSTDPLGIAGYYVYRGSSQIANVTGTSYTDSGLASSTQYTYTVKAYDSAGNISVASNAVTVTTLAGSMGSCHISYSIQSSWSTGFDAAINITNSSSSAITSWTLTWTWSGNQQLTQANGSTGSQSGQNVTLTSLSWDGSIAANSTLSGDVSIAGSYSGTNNNPTVFYLNGTQCQ